MTRRNTPDPDVPHPDVPHPDVPDPNEVRLGPLEHRVMEVLWSHDPLTIREVIDALGTDPAYTTIATVLGNLERKGCVLTHRVGRTVLFRPAHDREEFTARQMQSLLAQTGDRAGTILRFVVRMSTEDLELLRAHLSDPAGRE